MQVRGEIEGKEEGNGEWAMGNGGEEVVQQSPDGGVRSLTLAVRSGGALAVEQPVAQLIESSSLLFVSATQRGQAGESEELDEAEARGVVSWATSFAAARRSCSEKCAEGGGVTPLRVAQASRWRGV